MSAEEGPPCITPVRMEWSPLIFLLLFAAGLAVVGWMIAMVVAVNRRETSVTQPRPA